MNNFPPPTPNNYRLLEIHELIQETDLCAATHFTTQWQPFTTWKHLNYTNLTLQEFRNLCKNQTHLVARKIHILPKILTPEIIQQLLEIN